MRIHNGKVCHLANPAGYALGTPVFSWIVDEAEGKKAESSRLIVRTEEKTVLDTGWAQLDSLCTKGEFALEPMTEYFWTVSVRSDIGEEAVSEEYHFETGKMDTPWTGRWITCDSRQERHPIFYKQISPKDAVKKARLYICGLGLYEAYWNEKKIGDEYLTPYCNNYQNFLQAETFDVTEELQESGTLSVELGNGWYKGRFGFDESTFTYGNEWKLIAELHLTYEDGGTEIIGTDNTWMVKRANITFSNIYDGEHRDDTLPETEPAKAVYSDETMMPTDRISVPLTAHQIIHPEILVTPDNETVADMKQNISGIFTLRVHEPEGTVIRVQAGEVLQDDCFYRDNLRSAKAEYVYVSDGNEHVLRPKFTFYGYRYLKVEGISELKAEDITGIVLYSDVEKLGLLLTGNAKLNRLISNSRWGMRGNFVDVPTDCPQRDERMGWTGDAQVFSATAMYFADTYAFYRKYMYDMAKEQACYDGMVPMVVPSFGMADNPNPMGATATVWGDATTIIPWNQYQFSGDPSILKEHYPAMKAWVEYIRKTDGEDHHWRHVFHFGDWLALDGAARPDAVLGGTEEGFIADVYYRKSALIVAETAELLGYEEDAQTYRNLAEKIEKGIYEEYYTPSGRCAVMTQTGEILSIMNGLGAKDSAAAILARLLENNNRRLKTGFVGTPLLCPALTKTGRDDLAYDLLLNEKYPGWLYEVNLGATTIWERWNSLDETGHISSTGMNSLNHYSYGAIVQWMFERCAGLTALEPGFRRARIAPLPHTALDNLEMYYLSAAGPWQIRWQSADKKHLQISVSVPFGAEAEVILPLWDGVKEEGNPMFADVRDGVCHIPAGTYSAVYGLSEPIMGTVSVDTPIGDLMKYPGIVEMIHDEISIATPVLLASKTSQSLRKFAAEYGVSESTIEKMDQAIEKLAGN
ncbi:MAG: family 78 glycoside hydrolase catalytic domain [Erysipelotrichaceae bacterium]|nr:family 78 glycoside hydrolase catalytic domain [Erysipelotrichaceae bacterium]